MSNSVPPTIPPSPRDARWYYADASNQPIGPLPFADLQRLAAEGVIQAETYVLEEGKSEWRKYGEIAPAIPAPTPTPPLQSAPPSQPPTSAKKPPAWLTVLLLFLVYPVGLLALWLSDSFSPKRKRLLSGVFGVCFLVLIIASHFSTTAATGAKVHGPNPATVQVSRGEIRATPNGYIAKPMPVGKPITGAVRVQAGYIATPINGTVREEAPHAMQEWERRELERVEEEKAKGEKAKAEAIAAEQKEKETHARDIEFGGIAKTEFEKWILSKIPERKDRSIIGETEFKIYGDSGGTYTVELFAPRYEIWPDDVETQKANLTPADQLNGKLNGLEWRAFAFVDATAFRIIEIKKRGMEERKTISLWKDKHPAFEDGTWQSANSTSGLRLPFVGAYRIEKRNGVWTVAVENAFSNAKSFKDKTRQHSGRRAASPSESSSSFVAEGSLSLKSADSEPKQKGNDDATQEARAEFEKYVFERTPGTLVLRSEESVTKLMPKTASEIRDYTQETKTEYHSPEVIIEATTLTDADRLNGIEWRGWLHLKCDSSRVISISPEPDRRTSLNDGTWHNSSGVEEEFVATKTGGKWKIAPKLRRFRLLGRE